jgi:hypothetical protein
MEEVILVGLLAVLEEDDRAEHGIDDDIDDIDEEHPFGQGDRIDLLDGDDGLAAEERLLPGQDAAVLPVEKEELEVVAGLVDLDEGQLDRAGPDDEAKLPAAEALEDDEGPDIEGDEQEVDADDEDRPFQAPGEGDRQERQADEPAKGDDVRQPDLQPGQDEAPPGHHAPVPGPAGRAGRLRDSTVRRTDPRRPCRGRKPSSRSIFDPS